MDRSLLRVMRSFLMQRTVLSIGLAALASLVVAPSSALAQDGPSPPGPVEPEVQDIGLLFTQNATSGKLRALEGKSDRYVLTLNHIDRQVIWFQDRPGRLSGHMPIRKFIRAWDGYGFNDDRPNAALSVLDGADHQDTAILTLGPPRYDADKRKLRYHVRAGSEATGNLAHFEHAHDPGAVQRFGHAALFIDDALGQVINGCLIAAYVTTCPGKDLSGANLSGTNLGGANLAGANLSNTNLRYADLGGANLSRANLIKADLYNVPLYRADLSYANLLFANLDRTKLPYAKLDHASLFGASMNNIYFGAGGRFGDGPTYCGTISHDVGDLLTCEGLHTGRYIPPNCFITWPACGRSSTSSAPLPDQMAKLRVELRGDDPDFAVSP